MEGYARSADLDPSFSEALEGISKLTEDQQARAREDQRKQPVTLRFRNAGRGKYSKGLGKRVG